MPVGKRGDEGGEVRRTASESFRAASARRLALGMALSVAVHAGILWLPSGMGWIVGPVPGVPPRLVILPPAEPPPGARPPAVRLPPPPSEIARPGEPVAQVAAAGAEPEWIPHDVPPRLLNLEEVRDRLAEETAALEGARELLVVLWLYVESSGDVTKLRLRRPSGEDGVDRAAMDVAATMRFRPALFQGRTVAVWIVQPIRFSLQVAEGWP